MADALQIRVEGTPNPNSLKFSVNRTIWEGRAQTFNDAAQAFASPLARTLLAVPGVKSVFFLRDFVTVSREPEAAWEAIAPEVERVLREYLGGDG
jgi:hypothetical protein